ncbi:23S rRNA adenine methyltransferase [Nitzschia inconspicua]|uniref:23S rRNA adenine methyltransferase n=1 Tax=Nitzschia inconspicua TaxID=303405 RepID=A0A9K3KQI1_9STRA|nr:23S rRNA adenine methyltransferase [Nitzschia inconspicua]
MTSRIVTAWTTTSNSRFLTASRKSSLLDTNKITRTGMFSTTAKERTSKPCPGKRSSTKLNESASSSATSSSFSRLGMVNLHTIPLNELETLLVSWGHPKYRAKQVYQWIHTQGVTDVTQMKNIPKSLQQQLLEHSSPGHLTLHIEQKSAKDGTIKRAYKLHDGALIESVLMGPYQDGRYTACISSQAGCAQGCVFCATGQMGFTRQLTPEEIFEQVSRFASELAYEEKQSQREQKNRDSRGSLEEEQHGRSKRLSNIVFMGMGEPLANYRNVVAAIKRIQSELGIGYRRITVSTVGIVPNISKLAQDLPQVKLAVSLHCATDKERTALLPANRRYGGLDTLMETLQNYIRTVGKRVTLEWALIEGENDTPETAHSLGKLIQKWIPAKGKVNNMVHVNVIPLNPTGGFSEGKPSSRQRVRAFCDILQDKYGISCTPRVRRGIDIDAGCGQLTTKVMEEGEQTQYSMGGMDTTALQVVDSAAEDDDTTSIPIQWSIANDAMVWKDESIEGIDDGEDDNWEDNEYQTKEELDEASRLMKLVEGKTFAIPETITKKEKAAPR